MFKKDMSLSCFYCDVINKASMRISDMSIIVIVFERCHAPYIFLDFENEQANKRLNYSSLPNVRSISSNSQMSVPGCHNPPPYHSSNIRK